LTKVEDVARAISSYVGENPDEHDNNVSDGVFYPNWTAHEGLARAVIKAMRKASPGMCAAGIDADDKRTGGTTCAHIYAAMIDAALSEGEG
jgi:hypothetical protein